MSAGEFGPVLENPGGGGTADYYQSYYNNSASDYTTKRQTLEMARNHHNYTDRYRTLAGEGMVPVTGSFSWESIVRVLSTIGVTTGGRINCAWLISSNFREDIGGGDMRARGVQFRFDNYDSEAGTYEAVFTIVRNVYAHSTSVIATNLSVLNYYHFACVYDDDENMMRLYVDEELVASAGVTSYTRTNEVGICGWSINAEPSYSAGAIKAFIDDLAFTDDVRRPGNFVLGIHGTLIVIN